jgi:hypothetical protein
VTLPVFKTGDWYLRCQWCVRLAHASATMLVPSSVVADSRFRQRALMVHRITILRLRSGFRLQAPAALTPAKRLNFKTGDWYLRCQWCVRLAHASARLSSWEHLAIVVAGFPRCARDFGSGLRRPLDASRCVRLAHASATLFPHALPHGRLFMNPGNLYVNIDAA